jgi:uncharacterized membrane protein
MLLSSIKISLALYFSLSFYTIMDGFTVEFFQNDTHESVIVPHDEDVASSIAGSVYFCFHCNYSPNSNRFCRAGSLAHAVLLNSPSCNSLLSFFSSQALPFLNTLNTERTFFHHTSVNELLHQDSDTILVRSVHHTQDPQYLLGHSLLQKLSCSYVIEPVESSYFIWTVICAIAGSDTTVISHLVVTFCELWLVARNRTNVFTWCIFAMLTKHRLITQLQDFQDRRNNICRYASNAFRESELLLFFLQQEYYFLHYKK